ncbi:hypothetical protein [Pseudomonas lopnurensis]|nr:hypothetical protein [Pseudomonas lopnurensis]MBE7376630.1 hypothetical protein [Pseudomonas lopnurensis]
MTVASKASARTVAELGERSGQILAIIGVFVDIAAQLASIPPGMMTAPLHGRPFRRQACRRKGYIGLYRQLAARVF